MRALALAAAVAAAGCPAPGDPGSPRARHEAGLALTYYRQRAADGTVEKLVVVEQRRWIEIGADRTLAIDQVDDGADLATLVIKGIAPAGGLVLGRCARDSVVHALRSTPSAWIGRAVEITIADGRTVAGTIAAVADRQVVVAGDGDRTTVVGFDAWRAFRIRGGDAVVRCAVEVGHGRQLVRVVYATTALGFDAEHAIRATLDDAERGTVEIVPRFTVDTPAWQVAADVALFDGLPGGARPPRELFRGPITLSGERVVVSGPTVTAPARIEAVYRADLPDGESPRDPGWRTGATFGDVFDWLELDLGDASLPPGQMMVEVARPGRPPRLVSVADDALELPAPDVGGGATRIKLWPAPDLKGGRSKLHVSSQGTSLVESVVLSISNGGDRPREVVVEEELRPERRRLTVVRPFPRRPTLRDNVLRLRLEVPPGVARAGYILDYQL